MSDIGIEELQYLTRQYQKLPNGEERAEAIRHAIKRADELGIQEWRLSTRDDLIYQFCLWGDNGEMLPVLSEFVSIFEEQPMDRFIVAYLDTLYRAVCQWNWLSYLPLNERKKMSQQFLRACKQYHANLYEYYVTERDQCMKEGRFEEAEKYHEKSLAELQKNSLRQILSCKACKQAQKLNYATQKKDWDAVLRDAKPLLDGEVTCKQHPRGTARSLLHFALNCGDREKADIYAELFEQFPEPDWEEHTWVMMRYYTFTDLGAGLEIFCKELPYALGVHDQLEQKEFYEYSYVFWVQYARKYEKTVLELPKNFPLYQKSGVYSSFELADWFYENAMKIIKKFDTRNGYPYYQNLFLEKIEGMKKMEVVYDLPIPRHL